MPSRRILDCKDKSVVFTISEIAGTGSFLSLFYRDAGIALILYDISSHEGQLLAETHGWYFAETSAKSGEGIDKVFHDMGSALVENCKKEKESPTVSLCDSYVHRMKKTCC